MNSEIKIRMTNILKLGISEGKVTQAYSRLQGFGFQPTPAKMYLVKMPRYNEWRASHPIIIWSENWSFSPNFNPLHAKGSYMGLFLINSGEQPV